MKIFILVMFTLVSCKNEPDYYNLGVKSFAIENYALAKNQFKMVTKNDSKYNLAHKHLKKIDSIEKSILDSTMVVLTAEKKGKSIARKKYAGNYKVEVNSVSSDKEVEVYLLNENGTASWLWVYYKKTGKKIDDRKDGSWNANEDKIIIDIAGNSEMITETYELSNGVFRNTQIKKRWLNKTNESF